MQKRAGTHFSNIFDRLSEKKWEKIKTLSFSVNLWETLSLSSVHGCHKDLTGTNSCSFTLSVSRPVQTVSLLLDVFLHASFFFSSRLIWW